MPRPARFLVLLAWMALLTYWSNQPSLPIDQAAVANVMHDLQHKVAHLLAYGLMGLLAQWAFQDASRSWLVAIVVSSLFGITDELHQSFIPGRRSAIDDWLLDTASASLAVYVFSKLRRTRLQAPIQALAPLVVCAGFVVGIGLALRPALNSALAMLRVGST
jgi:VanZ family protein